MNKKIRLLVIDDDEDDKRLFIEAAKEVNEDIECLTAKDGRQALEILEVSDCILPDYIFLDLRMPRINGKKCLFEIKRNDKLRDIPVIIYTTSRELSESRELLEMGAIHFMSKPSNPDEIYYLISFVLEEQWLHRNKNQ